MTARTHGEPPFTYGDLCEWPEDERWELIDGEPYLMTAPSWQHQRVIVRLGSQLDAHFTAAGCRVFVAPFDVRLPRGDEPDEAIDTVLQPDLLVVCDRSTLSKSGCRGAPGLVVEIISPSTSARDHVIKRELYERHGVREYWLVHPLERTLLVYRRGDDGAFVAAEPIAARGRISSASFDGLAIDWDAVFADVTPDP